MDLYETSVNQYSFAPELTVGALKGFYPNLKSITFKCVKSPEVLVTTDTDQSKLNVPVQKKVNAFNILLSGAKVPLIKKSTW